MQYILAHYDHVSIALVVVGGLCAIALRKIPASALRGWTKLVAFLLIAFSLMVTALGGYQQETRRTITPLDADGVLVNLHTVTSGYRSSPTQHYNVSTADDGLTRDLHDEEALFFMTAENGEQVDLSYTKESGYVTKLRILSGPHAGFQFVEPDIRNTTPDYFFLILGVIVGSFGIFKWVVDHRADPATGG